MPSDYTLILIVGRRQNVAQRFRRALNSFMPPVSAIERIEVIRGRMSTLYGSDARPTPPPRTPSTSTRAKPEGWNWRPAFRCRPIGS